MISSSRTHVVFGHRYAGASRFDPIKHPRPYARLGPLKPNGPRIESVPFLEEPLIKDFRISIRETRGKGGFKFLDEDYSTVESYLRKAFKKKASLHVSDVADALGMDYGTVREMIALMINEGKLGVK